MHFFSIAQIFYWHAPNESQPISTNRFRFWIFFSPCIEFTLCYVYHFLNISRDFERFSGIHFHCLNCCHASFQSILSHFWRFIRICFFFFCFFRVNLLPICRKKMSICFYLCHIFCFFFFSFYKRQTFWYSLLFFLFGLLLPVSEIIFIRFLLFFHQIYRTPTFFQFFAKRAPFLFFWLLYYTLIFKYFRYSYSLHINLISISSSLIFVSVLYWPTKPRKRCKAFPFCKIGCRHFQLNLNLLLFHRFLCF